MASYNLPDVANDLLHAQDTGKKAMEDFIKARLVESSVVFHEAIKRNKLKAFASSEVTKKLTCSQNKISQIRAERNVFAQLVFLSLEHDVDLEITLSFPLGPVPWPLATADGMPAKTDKSTLLHNLESGIEPTLDRSSDAVHIIDGNAMLQSFKPIPDTFQELAEHVYDKLPKSHRVDFITDTYKPKSIKSYERASRGMAPTVLLPGAMTKTPHYWSNFMSNGKNKIQLINLLLEQWKIEKYAAKLVDRNIYYVIGEKVYCLMSEEGTVVSSYPEENILSSQEEADTRIILHCLNVSRVFPKRVL